MLAGLAAGALLWSTGREIIPDRLAFALAAAMILARLLANMLDGMIAVEGNSCSPVGELYNEVPDRVSDTAILVGAGFAIGASPTLGYLAAIGALFVTYVRTLGKGAGHPSDFRGPMAKQQRMFLVIVCSLFLAVAPPAWHPALPPMLDASSPGLLFIILAMIILGCVVTFFRRLLTLAARLRGDAR